MFGLQSAQDKSIGDVHNRPEAAAGQPVPIADHVVQFKVLAAVAAVHHRGIDDVRVLVDDRVMTDNRIGTNFRAAADAGISPMNSGGVS